MSFTSRVTRRHKHLGGFTRIAASENICTWDEGCWSLVVVVVDRLLVGKMSRFGTPITMGYTMDILDITIVNWENPWEISRIQQMEVRFTYHMLGHMNWGYIP